MCKHITQGTIRTINHVLIILKFTRIASTWPDGRPILLTFESTLLLQESWTSNGTLAYKLQKLRRQGNKTQFIRQLSTLTEDTFLVPEQCYGKNSSLLYESQEEDFFIPIPKFIVQNYSIIQKTGEVDLFNSI